MTELSINEIRVETKRLEGMLERELNDNKDNPIRGSVEFHAAVVNDAETSYVVGVLNYKVKLLQDTDFESDRQLQLASLLRRK